MAETPTSIPQRLLSACSKVAVLTGAAVFLFGDKFLFEIKHGDFLTSEVVGMSCGILLIFLGAAIRPTRKQDFPADFTIQTSRNASAIAISHLPGEQIAAYFRENPAVANELLTESYDKRASPSTFIAEDGDGYRVGWYSNGFKCEKSFKNLADAATDYVLFSLKRGRWSPDK